MKKIGLLNQPLSNVIAGLGHTDMLTIADAGLPIPSGTERIDLAIQKGLPAFMDVLKAVLSEMQVESVIIAAEMKEKSPELYKQVKAALGDIPMTEVTHETFKKKTPSAKAVVRTGEFTPYANIILVSGVVF